MVVISGSYKGVYPTVFCWLGLTASIGVYRGFTFVRPTLRCLHRRSFGRCKFSPLCFTFGRGFGCILFMTSRCIPDHTRTRRHWFAPFGMTHWSFGILLRRFYDSNVFMSSRFFYVPTPTLPAPENLLDSLGCVIGFRRLCVDVGSATSTPQMERVVLEEIGLEAFSFLVNKLIVTVNGLWSELL